MTEKITEEVGKLKRIKITKKVCLENQDHKKSMFQLKVTNSISGNFILPTQKRDCGLLLPDTGVPVDSGVRTSHDGPTVMITYQAYS